MGYRSISSLAVAVGRATSQSLWLLVRNNFRSHESRITDIEANNTDLPTGTILPYCGASAPSGWLLCDGSAVSQTTYADLFAIVSTTYGNPGGGDFNLPDFRSRSPMGSGTGSGLTARSIADTGGNETHTLTEAELPTHSHGVTDPGHFHSGLYDTEGGASQWYHGVDGGSTQTPTRTTNSATTGITLGSTGGSGAHNNVHPCEIVNFIIKT